MPVKQIVIRVLLLAVAGVSLYLLAPKLLQVFSSWPELRKLDPLWLGVALLFETVSFISVWTLQRIALRTRAWFPVATSQLAANAAGSVVPGGGAAASAVQFGMLARAGMKREAVVSGLAAAGAATAATAFALPVVASIAAIGGTAAPHGLREVAYIGGGAFVLMGVVCAAAFVWNRPLELVGRAARHAGGWIGKGEQLEDLPQRLLAQRDRIRSAFAARPGLALLSAVGKWGFDYLALVCVLAALGARPEPALVLLAYAAASLLGMIPLTPGGLGFVEAGLTGLLVLAGVDAGTAAVATLAYRLVAYWLPLPVGAGAFLLARRRYGRPPSAATTSSDTSEAASSPP